MENREGSGEGTGEHPDVVVPSSNSPAPLPSHLPLKKCGKITAAQALCYIFL